MSHIFLDEII